MTPSKIAGILACGFLLSACQSQSNDHRDGQVIQEAADAVKSDDAAGHLAIRQERDGAGNLSVYVESDDVDRKIGCTVERRRTGKPKVGIAENTIVPGEKRFIEYNAGQNSYAITNSHYETAHLGDARSIVNLKYKTDNVGNTYVYVVNSGTRKASCTITITNATKPWRQKIMQNLTPGETRFIEFNNERNKYDRSRAWYE